MCGMHLIVNAMESIGRPSSRGMLAHGRGTVQ